MILLLTKLSQNLLGTFLLLSAQEIFFFSSFLLHSKSMGTYILLLKKQTKVLCCHPIVTAVFTKCHNNGPEI